MKKLTDPIHPGEILADELDAIQMTAAMLASSIGIPENCLDDILNENSGVTADIAMRLGVFLNTGPHLWMNLQKSYERDIANPLIQGN